MKSWVLGITYFMIYPLYASDSCNFSSLTNNCNFLRNLKGNEVLEFSNGQRMPACALHALDDAKRDQQDERERLSLMKIQGIFNKSKIQMDSNQLNNFLINMHIPKPSEAKKILWPPLPLDGEKDFKSITAEDFQIYWQKQLGGKKSYDNFINAFTEYKSITSEGTNQRYGNKPSYSLRGQSERATALFKTAKTAVINNVLKGRSESQLSPAEKAVLKKIREVSFNADYTSEMDCGPNYPAALSMEDKVVGLPPSQLFLPDQSLLRVLIHEISHSFDACRLSESKSSNITMETSPFFPVQQCLASQEGGNFGQRESNPNGPLNSDDACYLNQHNEAFCDWHAAEILGAHPELLDSAPMGPSPQLEVGVETGPVIKVPRGLDVLMNQVDLACAEAPPSKFDKDAGHPRWGNRVNDIMLRSEGIKKRAGCKGTAPPACSRTNNAEDLGDTAPEK